MTNQRAHICPSHPRRQNYGPIFYPVYNVSLALLTVGGRGNGAQFMRSKINVPSSSKLNEEEAHLKRVCPPTLPLPEPISAFLYPYVSLRLSISTSLCFSVAQHPSLLYVSLLRHLPYRLSSVLSLLLIFRTAYLFVHRDNTFPFSKLRKLHGLFSRGSEGSILEGSLVYLLRIICSYLL